MSTKIYHLDLYTEEGVKGIYIREKSPRYATGERKDRGTLWKKCFHGLHGVPWHTMHGEHSNVGSRPWSIFPPWCL